ncbi:MAG: prenyltransferase [Alphaproteobacteria bacterium]
MAEEPSIASLGGDAPGQVALRFFLATRPQFLSASVLPVMLGSAWGWRVTGNFDGAAFALTLAVMVSVHAGANVLNDVHDTDDDDANDDRIYPYSGGSRFIQNGVMSARSMMCWAWTLLGIGIGCGLTLTVLKGIGVIGFGMAGLALAIFYSAPPVRLSARGLGAAAVGIAFGLLPVTGAAWVQSATIDAGIILLSIAVSLWMADMLLINQVPDARADSADEKRTLAVRLGRTGTGWLYRWIHAAAVLAVMAAAVAGFLPIWAAIPPLALLLPAWRAGTVIIDNPDDRAAMEKAIRMTIGIHGVGTLWLLLVAVVI